MLHKKLKGWQLFKKNRQRLLQSLLLTGTIFTTSCSTYQPIIKNDDLILFAIPDFPIAHPDVVKELKEVCPKDKCIRLHEWFAKLLVFKKQLAVLKKPTI